MRSLLGQLRERLFVGDRAPQPGRDGLFLDLLQARRHAGLAEILLREHVGGDLRPGRRHLDIVGVEHHRAVRIADLARGQAELDVRVGRLAFLGVAPLDPHCLAPFLRPAACGDSPQYRPPTPVSCADPVPTRASTRLTRLVSVNACPAVGPASGPIVAARPDALLRRQDAPLRCRCGGRSGYAGPCQESARRVLQTTRAERSEARTTLPLPSRPSVEFESNAKCCANL